MFGGQEGVVNEEFRHGGGPVFAGEVGLFLYDYVARGGQRVDLGILGFEHLMLIINLRREFFNQT